MRTVCTRRVPVVRPRARRVTLAQSGVTCGWQQGEGGRTKVTGGDGSDIASDMARARRRLA
jgi:hypothetical protein